jgi:hypothetical protein
MSELKEYSELSTRGTNVSRVKLNTPKSPYSPSSFKLSVTQAGLQFVKATIEDLEKVKR